MLLLSSETVSPNVIVELRLLLIEVFCPLQEVNMVKVQKSRSKYNCIVCLLIV